MQKIIKFILCISFSFLLFCQEETINQRLEEKRAELIFSSKGYSTRCYSVDISEICSIIDFSNDCCLAYEEKTTTYIAALFSKRRQDILLAYNEIERELVYFNNIEIEDLKIKIEKSKFVKKVPRTTSESLKKSLRLVARKIKSTEDVVIEKNLKRQFRRLYNKYNIALRYEKFEKKNISLEENIVRIRKLLQILQFSKSQFLHLSHQVDICEKDSLDVSIELFMDSVDLLLEFTYFRRWLI